jgi:pimeloyl-ACP methyl ester carboxylesterase
MRRTSAGVKAIGHMDRICLVCLSDRYFVTIIINTDNSFLNADLYTGTANDVSHVMTHLQSYLPFKIAEHICGGVSLGGHATWILLMNEPRIRAGLVVIGCPDYVRLMTDRAGRSKLPSALNNNGEPDVRKFLGSESFPPALIEAVEKYDPAGILLGELDIVTGDDYLHEPSEPEKKRLTAIINERLAGKKIICLSGGQDRLVPHKQGEPLITWLRKAVDVKSGWYKDHGVDVVDIVDPKARHEFSASMRKHAEDWLCGYLADGDGNNMASKL